MATTPGSLLNFNPPSTSTVASPPPLIPPPLSVQQQGLMQSFLGLTPASSTTSPSATNPVTPRGPTTNPKTVYTQNVASSLAPANLTPQTNPTTQAYNQQYGLGFMNGSSYNPSGQQIVAPQVQPGGQNQSASSVAPNPYQTPEYQSYVNQYVQSQLPSFTPAQYQTGITGTQQQLAGIQQNYANQVGNTLGESPQSSEAVTGQEAAAAQNLANQTVPLQTQLNMYQNAQQQAGTAYGAQVSAANLGAGYTAGLQQPQTISPGSQIVLPNASTGTSTPIAGEPSYAAGTNAQTGAPYTYNQVTGAINPQGTTSGLGSTPPNLNGQVVSPSDPYYSTLQTAAGLLASNQVGAAQNIMAGMPSAVQSQVYQMAEAQGYNANTAAGMAAAQQSNTQTAGTAAVNANAAAYANSVPAVQQLNQALNNVTDLGNMTVENAQGNNVNPFTLVTANQTLANARDLLSSKGQATFDSNITQLQAAIQSLYSQGGGQTPSNITSSINKLANQSLSISGLQSLLSAAEAEGNTLLTNAKNTAVSEYQNTQSGSSGVGDNGTSLYNF